MGIECSLLGHNSTSKSGRVRRFTLPGTGTRVTQIPTFCPDVVGPGPTHVYLIESDILVLLDTGIPTSLAKKLFYTWRGEQVPSEIEALPWDYSERQIAAGLQAAGYGFGDVDLLVISHGHPDHFLQGSSILRHGKAKVLAHLFETSAICNPWEMLSRWIAGREKTVALGMPEPLYPSQNLLDHVNREAHGLAFPVHIPVFQDSLLRINGARIDDIHVKHLPGHSAGSIGLLVGRQDGRKILLPGDAILYPITPIPGDLLSYLRTLGKLERLEDVTLVLPAHGKAIKDLRSRVLSLQKHHHRRLKLTYEACHTPRTLWEIATMPRYFNMRLDPDKFNPLASTETLAHMELLLMAGGIFRSHIRHGVHYFQNSGEPFREVYERVLELVKEERVHPILRY
ncbi:MAG: MBL fold metallo-hydrolase [Deltaproteobacteria bacterium]|nr:MBL fold metallo-hydrolase [Deltaproteobacteria bacterium]